MTVADLMARLEKLEPETVVFVECEDSYYNGPLISGKLIDSEALLIGPFGYLSPAEDEKGRPIKQHTRTSLGGWTTKEERGEDGYGEILERRPCLIIRAE